MADSLRDQLIAAGFEAPKKPAKKPKHNSGNSKDRKQGARNKKAPNKKHSKDPASQQKTASASDEALERKKLKAQIKELIDSNKLENWKGEVAYRYTVEKRIRELFVTEAVQKQLTNREAAITRLNGDTYLVPIAIAAEIIKINPQWSVFNATDVEEKDTEDDGYSDFQVPDDLQW